MSAIKKGGSSYVLQSPGYGTFLKGSGAQNKNIIPWAGALLFWSRAQHPWDVIGRKNMQQDIVVYHSYALLRLQTS